MQLQVPYPLSLRTSEHKEYRYHFHVVPSKLEINITFPRISVRRIRRASFSLLVTPGALAFSGEQARLDISWMRTGNDFWQNSSRRGISRCHNDCRVILRARIALLQAFPSMICSVAFGPSSPLSTHAPIKPDPSIWFPIAFWKHIDI